MRWLILAITIFFGFLFLLRSNDTTKLIISTPVVTPTQAPQPSRTIDLMYEDMLYQVDMIEVSKKETVSLFLNLKEKLTLSQTKDKNTCRAVVNGGFYSKSDTPIGLFKTNGQIINPRIKSALLNGFLLINPNQSVITDQIPDASFQTALQTGPLLILNSKQQALRINNDEPARRMVAGKISSGQLIFLAIYNPNSTFDGPLLGDLPAILKKWESKALVAFTDAINLDGGSASGMVSDSINVGELTYVGSYFCIK